MRLKIRQSRNPRTGKPVTVISGIRHNPQVIDRLASQLKSSCGTGGHVSGKEIILQGSHPEKAAAILEKEGFETETR